MFSSTELHEAVAGSGSVTFIRALVKWPVAKANLRSAAFFSPPAEAQRKEIKRNTKKRLKTGRIMEHGETSDYGLKHSLCSSYQSRCLQRAVSALQRQPDKAQRLNLKVIWASGKPGSVWNHGFKGHSDPIVLWIRTFKMYRAVINDPDHTCTHIKVRWLKNTHKEVRIRMMDRLI